MLPSLPPSLHNPQAHWPPQHSTSSAPPIRGHITGPSWSRSTLTWELPFTTKGHPIVFWIQVSPPQLPHPPVPVPSIVPSVCQNLLVGVQFPLTELLEDQHHAEVWFALRWGNHQSVHQQVTAVQTLLQKEVAHRWQLSLPRHLIASLPRAIVAPLGLVSQATINAQGEMVPKHRLTHNQSL